MKILLFFLLIFSITLTAQTIEDNTTWKSSHGNSTINKDSIFLEPESGIFVDYNFEACKYYRLLIYSKSSSIDVAFTNGLSSSNSVDKPTNFNIPIDISKAKVLDDYIIVDSISTDIPFSQLWIFTNDQAVTLHNIYLQPIYLEKLDIENHTFSKNYLYSGNKVVFTNDTLQKTASVEVLAKTSIDLHPGVSIIPGATFSANIVRLANENVSCKIERKEDILIIYELITTEKDGKNDFWEITNIQSVKHKIEVFSPSGQRVFHSLNYENNWHADNLSKGSYFYKIELTDLKKTYNGTLIIN